MEASLKRLISDYKAGLLPAEDMLYVDEVLHRLQERTNEELANKIFLVDVEVTHRLRFRVEGMSADDAKNVAEIDALNICPVQVMDSEFLDKVLDSQITNTRVRVVEE